MRLRNTLAAALGLPALVLALALSLGARADDAATSGPAPLRHADLRGELLRMGLGVRGQGERPTCSVFTVTGALEFALAKARGRPERLSVEYLNWAANEAMGFKRTRQYFQNLVRGFEAHGIAADADMPYRATYDSAVTPTADVAARARTAAALGLEVHWIRPLPKEPGIDDEAIREIERALEAGYPVCAGSSHSILLIGFLRDPAQPGGGLFFTSDSAGVGHYGSLTYEAARKRLADLLWIEARGGRE